MTHGRVVALQQQKHFIDAAKSCVTSLHNAASRSLFALARLGRISQRCWTCAILSSAQLHGLSFIQPSIPECPCP